MQKKMTIKYHAEFKSNNDNEILVWFSEPVNTPTQVISNFNLIPGSARYSDRENLIHFQQLHGKVAEITANMTVNLKPSVKPEVIKKALANDEHYLKAEKYLEQTPSIIEKTSSIIDDKKELADIVEAIFEYVASNFEYCYPVAKRGVAHLDLQKLVGDCGEYSGLFVTMCRIAGIPARNVTGFVNFDDELHEHAWSQVYTSSGWLDVDTQYASLEDSIDIGKNKYLFGYPELRLITSFGWNLVLKPHIPVDFRTDEANELGILMNKNSTQILQPLAFASKDKLSFTDGISLEKK